METQTQPLEMSIVLLPCNCPKKYVIIDDICTGCHGFVKPIKQEVKDEK
jgi:hypothetical protein